MFCSFRIYGVIKALEGHGKFDLLHARMKDSRSNRGILYGRAKNAISGRMLARNVPGNIKIPGTRVPGISRFILLLIDLSFRSPAPQ